MNADRVDVYRSHDGVTYVSYDCPGCGFGHSLPIAPLPVGAGLRPTWTYNHDAARPTLKPSIRIQFEMGVGMGVVLCHSFMIGGQLEFLPDCTHGLAGQTVPLPLITDVDPD